MEFDERDAWKYTWSGVAWARFEVYRRRLVRGISEPIVGLLNPLVRRLSR